MPMYAGEFTAKEAVWGTFDAEATDRDQFEFLMQNYIRDTYEDASDIEITEVKEIG